MRSKIPKNSDLKKKPFKEFSTPGRLSNADFIESFGMTVGEFTDILTRDFEKNLSAGNEMMKILKKASTETEAEFNRDFPDIAKFKAGKS